jgi:hypothetical protein
MFAEHRASTWAFALYHHTLITSNYRRAKRLATTWRVLVAVWCGGADSPVRQALRVRQQASVALNRYLASTGPEQLPLVRQSRSVTGN